LFKEELIMEAVFTRFDNEDNWVQGECGGFSFDAKLYNNPSRFGIDGGRISKLCIQNQYGMMANWDRGWDIEPSEEFMEEYEAIVDLLENSDVRDFG